MHVESVRPDLFWRGACNFLICSMHHAPAFLKPFFFFLVPLSAIDAAIILRFFALLTCLLQILEALGFETPGQNWAQVLKEIPTMRATNTVSH